MIVYAAFFIGYLLLLVAISFQYGRKVHSQEDFSIAGRSLPTTVAFLTMLSTWTGTGSLFSIAEAEHDQQPADQPIRHRRAHGGAAATPWPSASLMIAQSRLAISLSAIFFHLSPAPVQSTTTLQFTGPWVSIMVSSFGLTAGILTCISPAIRVTHTVTGPTKPATSAIPIRQW